MFIAGIGCVRNPHGRPVVSSKRLLVSDVPEGWEDATHEASHGEEKGGVKAPLGCTICDGPNPSPSRPWEIHSRGQNNEGEERSIHTPSSPEGSP